MTFDFHLAPLAPRTHIPCEWIEDNLYPRTGTAARFSGKKSPNLVVKSSDEGTFRIGDIVRVVRTGEAVLVTTVSGRSLTVNRGQGRTRARLIRPWDRLLIVGSAPTYWTITKIESP